MGSLYILHLADLHIDINSNQESSPMTESLCRKLREFHRKHEANSLDLILISGDLVNRGSNSYSFVRERLNAICNASDTNKDRIFFVPGNHDIEREKCDPHTYGAFTLELKKDPSLFSKFEKNESLQIAFREPFSRYNEFARSYKLINAQDFCVPGFACADLPLDGLNIRLCGLNTALVSGENCNGDNSNFSTNRCCGFPYLSKMLANTSNKLNIVVSHYPLSWLEDTERQKTLQLLAQNNSILLTGHAHRQIEETSGLAQASLLQLGTGTAYGENWEGRNHCRIIELDPGKDDAVLHDWYWTGDYGWRSFEPLEVHCKGWAVQRKNFKRPTKLNVKDIIDKAQRVGLNDIQNNRHEDSRAKHFLHIIDVAAPESDLVIIGRSLKHWADCSHKIEKAINEKGIHVKLGLLDENSLPNKKLTPDDDENKSWIEKPDPHDWAMDDVAVSMAKYRRIRISKSSKGSLKVYGLPFYVPHSFVAYTDVHDGERYCSEEAGLATEEFGRPFIEVRTSCTAGQSYGLATEGIYKSMLTPDRLLFLLNAKENRSQDTTNRAKIICSKVDKHGLVDLVVGRKNIDWRSSSLRDVIEDTPVGGEIFMVGRSLVAWDNHELYKPLFEGINKKGLQCNLVTADPTIYNLRSLVQSDYAMEDLRKMWPKFLGKLKKHLLPRTESRSGYLEIFGIPAYVPVSFASYTRKNSEKTVRYCSLEPGIAVIPEERPIMLFAEKTAPSQEKIGNLNPDDYDGNDVYNALNNIYRRIIHDDCRAENTKLLFSTKREYSRELYPIKGNASIEGKKKNVNGWIIGHFIKHIEGLRRSTDIEIKWGVHPKGEARHEPNLCNWAITFTLLIKGVFKVSFADPHEPILLEKEGDYVMTPQGLAHSWMAQQDSTVLTVRWPSCSE
ncbi:MAG: metallophosphoesterase [Deltaproteobacteria bacterium]|nr:metallophosphoesterase [Deltaproteobacteria bacterium]